MIRPEGFRAAAFGTASDGDARNDPEARSRISRQLDISEQWATVSQVHGAVVAHASGPGHIGEADAIITQMAGLPITVATADCVPLIIEADHSAAVVHAGWRGLEAGIVEAALDAIVATGDEPRRAAIGPAIGPCCYEVGSDVAARFPRSITQTTWATPSVDLRRIALERLRGLEVWVSDRCTLTDAELNSHRADGTSSRQVAVTWLPPR